MRETARSMFVDAVLECSPSSPSHSLMNPSLILSLISQHRPTPSDQSIRRVEGRSSDNRRQNATTDRVPNDQGADDLWTLEIPNRKDKRTARSTEQNNTNFAQERCLLLLPSFRRTRNHRGEEEDKKTHDEEEAIMQILARLPSPLCSSTRYSSGGGPTTFFRPANWALL